MKSSKKFIFVPGTKLSFALMLFVLFSIWAMPAAAQTDDNADETAAAATTATTQTPATPSPVQSTAPMPLVHDLSGVTLGMTSSEAKDKLGKPDTSDANSMYFVLDNGRSVQIKLDKDKKVTMVAAIYNGNKANAPEFFDVFGPGASAQTNKKGSLYKMVRYPAAGYWVAYSRLDLDSGPMTTITMQKMAKRH